MITKKEQQENRAWCYRWYNATSTETENDQIETYVSWLERNLKHKHELLGDKSHNELIVQKVRNVLVHFMKYDDPMDEIIKLLENYKFNGNQEKDKTPKAEKSPNDSKTEIA